MNRRALVYWFASSLPRFLGPQGVAAQGLVRAPSDDSSRSCIHSPSDKASQVPRSRSVQMVRGPDPRSPHRHRRASPRDRWRPVPDHATGLRHVRAPKSRRPPDSGPSAKPHRLNRNGEASRSQSPQAASAVARRVWVSAIHEVIRAGSAPASSAARLVASAPIDDSARWSPTRLTSACPCPSAHPSAERADR